MEASSRGYWRLQNANTDSGHWRVGRNDCGACHTHRTARAACGSQYRFCGGIAQIGPASVRHRRRFDEVIDQTSYCLLFDVTTKRAWEFEHGIFLVTPKTSSQQ
jgi:hypothetical protein